MPAENVLLLPRNSSALFFPGSLCLICPTRTYVRGDATPPPPGRLFCPVSINLISSRSPPSSSVVGQRPDAQRAIISVVRPPPPPSRHWPALFWEGWDCVEAKVGEPFDRLRRSPFIRSRKRSLEPPTAAQSPAFGLAGCSSTSVRASLASSASSASSSRRKAAQGLAAKLDRPSGLPGLCSARGKAARSSPGPIGPVRSTSTERTCF